MTNKFNDSVKCNSKQNEIFGKSSANLITHKFVLITNKDCWPATCMSTMLAKLTWLFCDNLILLSSEFYCYLPQWTILNFDGGYILMLLLCVLYLMKYGWSISAMSQTRIRHSDRNESRLIPEFLQMDFRKTRCFNESVYVMTFNQILVWCIFGYTL